ICERAIIRPLANSHHLSLVMATVGASILLQGLARMRWGDDIYTFPPLLADAKVTVAGVPIAMQNLLVIAASLVVMIALYVFFTYTKLGRQVKAVSQSLVGAQIIGIDPNRVYRSTWMLSGAIGAIAGVL